MPSSTTTPQKEKDIKRTILQRFPIPNLPGYEQRLVLLEYPPGAKAPLHNHPVAFTGYILEGNVISQWPEGEEERYGPGDSFVDRAEEVHLRSENASQTEWLRFVACCVIKVEDAGMVPL